MKRNPEYEAGFIKAVAEGMTPEEEALHVAVAGRRRKLLLGGALVLVVALVTAGTLQLRKDTPAKQLARAQAHASRGEHRSAVIEFKRSLQESPDQPEARFELARELALLRDHKSAEIEYRKALAGHLPPDRVLVPLVEAVLAQGKFDRVIEDVNGATIESPMLNAELQTMLGTAYIAIGKTEEGRDAFRAARQQIANFPGAAIAEARFIVTQGRYDVAQAMLSSVPHDDKRQSGLQALTGDIASALKKPQEALVAYNEALRLDQDNPGVRLRLAQLYVDFGQFDLARSQIDTVTRLHPNDGSAQYLSAMVAYVRRDFTLANDAIQRSLPLLPGNGSAHLLAGLIDVERGEVIAAETHLQESIRLLPSNMQARTALVSLYLQRQKPVQADEVLQAAIALQPTNPDFAALAVKVALLQGNAVLASNLFEQSGGGRTKDAGTSLVGASLLFAAGKPDAAIARLHAAAEAHPENSEVDAALIMGNLPLRRTDAAMAAWQSLVRKKPDSARTYELRSQIDAARNDATASRQALERATALDPLYFPAHARLVILDLQAQRPDLARARLNRLIADAPGSVEPLLLLVQVEEGERQPPALAAALLKTARTRDPKSIAAINDTIAFHRRHGDAAAELATAEEGLVALPNNQDLLALVGDLSRRAGNRERSLAAFTRLTTLNNEHPDYSFWLGEVQLSMNQTEAALASFRNAYKRAPQRTDLQFNTVEAFLAAGKPDDAKRMLFEVTQKSPDSPLIAELSADIKMAEKQFPEALAGYQQALVTEPSTRLAIKTYKAMMLAKQRAQANALLANWQTRHPSDAGMVLFGAQVALDAKDFARAAVAFRRALDLQPDDPAILNNLAWTLDQSGDPKSLAYAERAHALAPDNAELADTLAGILVNQGQTQRGVDVMTKAITLAPAKLDLRVRLAKAQLKDGRKDAARTTLQTVIDKAPDSAEGNESKSILSTL